MKSQPQLTKSGRFAAMLMIIALIAAVPAFSHLADRTAAGGIVARDHWASSSFPIQWSLNPSINSNVQGSRSVADVMQSSFNTWTAAPNAALSVVRTGDSGKTTSGFDGVNLICFVCSGDFTKDSGTLAITLTTVATDIGSPDGRGGKTQFIGQLLDADILFNPSVNFSTAGGSTQDLQTVATHEIGHFFGLSHSSIARAMMFPFAPNLQTTLSYDDVAGISALYPSSSPAVPTTVISGTVRLGNSAVFGAHVYADSQSQLEPFSSFNIRKSPIGTLTLPDGSYAIEGVPADAYRVTAEPLDLPVTNRDVSDFAPAYAQSSVQTNFTTRWH